MITKDKLKELKEKAEIAMATHYRPNGSIDQYKQAAMVAYHSEAMHPQQSMELMEAFEHMLAALEMVKEGFGDPVTVATQTLNAVLGVAEPVAQEPASLDKPKDSGKVKGKKGKK